MQLTYILGKAEITSYVKRPWTLAFGSFVGEVMESFDLKFHIYDVHGDCTTLELGKKEIPGYNPSQGLGYYEFTQAEYISLKAKVMLMNQV